MKEIEKNLRFSRREYERERLTRANVPEDPIELLQAWLKEAVDAEITDANAMMLSTIGTDNRPSARIVLLRGVDDRGLRFFTNYNSKKGRDMAVNPVVSLAFYWYALEKQVRVTGLASKSGEEESDDYFTSRPRESQIAAWASAQSEALEGREAIEEAYARYEKEYEGQQVPRPQNWGGYTVRPDDFEFWQGRQNRLHDRIRYARGPEGDWLKERLAP